MLKHTVLLCLLLIGMKIVTGQQLELPIEVFRIKTNDTPIEWIDVEERTFELESFGAGNLWLFLLVNNLNSAASMQYRIKSANGTYGPWQSCVPNWEAFPKDHAYGGLGGGFGTTSFSTPLSGAIPNSENTIMFRFVPGPNEETSGYRIVELTVRAINDKNAPDLITTPRNYVSGANFEGPFEGSPQRAAMAQAGKELWEGTTGNNLLDRFGNTIQAKCTHCHTQNGSDLKYFNYSDKSIIARANFHGLSKQEGEQIAQYVRDLLSDRSENGRPWEPPYQPGPDAEVDPAEWAAGQGLKSVLENDSAMLEELFGSSDPSKAAIRNTIDGFTSNTNLRTMMLSVQFPDWNMWLPETHPMDQPDLAGSWNSLEQAYTTLRNKLDSPGKITGLNSKNGVGLQYMQNGIAEAFGIFASDVQRVVANLPGSTWAGTTFFPNSPVWAENVNNNLGQTAIRREQAKRSIAAWYSVKLFEVIEEFELYNLNLGNIPDTNEEFLEWPVREWSVFQNAAHIIGASRNLSYFSDDDGNENKETRGTYLSSIWYQLQLTLTPGNRRGGQIEPNDYAYNLQHIHRLGAKSNIYEPVRFLQNYIKAAEQRNTGKLPKDSPWNGPGYPGWNMRELSPWRLYSTGRGDRSTFTALPETLRIRLQEVFLDEVMQVLEEFEDNWSRVPLQNGGARTDYQLEQRGTVPLDGADNAGNCLFLDRRGDCNDSNDAVEIDAFYTLLGQLSQDGELSCEVFDRIRDWALARWDYPAANWPTCQTTAPTGYTLTVNNGGGSGSYTEGTIIDITANIPNGQVFDTWTGDTQFLANPNLANTQLTMPAINATVTATFKSPEAETYSLTVNNGDGSGSYTEGTIIDIMANIPNGQVFDTWTGDTQLLTNPDLASTQLTMPAANATITATFTAPEPETYTLTVNNGNGSGTYAKGTVVNVTANIPDGQVFDTWSGDIQYLANPDMENTQLTMPDTEVTVTATFKGAESGTYTLTVANGTGSGDYNPGMAIGIAAKVQDGQIFDSWVGNIDFIVDVSLPVTTLVMPQQDVYVEATFKEDNPTTYNLSLINGTGAGNYPVGTEVEITAVVEEGFEFVEWVGDTNFLADTKTVTTIVIMPERSILLEAIVQPKNPDGLKIYPNPASQIVQISFETDQEFPVFIRLWGLEGKLLRSKKITKKQEGVTFPVGNLPEAIYVLEFVSLKVTKKTKITVKH